MAATTHETFQIYHDDFRAIIGNDPTIELLHQVDSYPFAHEAGVWVNETNELFVTSAQFKDGVHAQKRVQLSKIVVPGDHGSSHPVRHEEIESGEVPMGNGGVNYGDKHIIFCSQGSPTRPSGLIMMDNHPPYKTEPLITTFLGRPFNSVNDVVVHSDGSIWFTDPCYGFDQCFRPRPSLPNCVYRYEPSTQAIRAVADGFGRPNGICFSPDEKTVYITDTDQFHGDSKDHSRAASIYAFDVAQYHGQPFLVNKRLFALVDTGFPDGIKCDLAGNVYSGCGDGINVWSPGGVLLGKIIIHGGAANFCFGRNGRMFILNEHRIWSVQLDSPVRGALLGI